MVKLDRMNKAQQPQILFGAILLFGAQCKKLIRIRTIACPNQIVGVV